MLEDHVTSDCDVIATLSAGCLASLLKYVEQDQLEQVFQNHMQSSLLFVSFTMLLKIVLNIFYYIIPLMRKII